MLAEQLAELSNCLAVGIDGFYLVVFMVREWGCSVLGAEGVVLVFELWVHACGWVFWVLGDCLCVGFCLIFCCKQSGEHSEA